MAVNISTEVEKILCYAKHKKLITSEDLIYTKNRLLETLSLDEIKDENIEDKEYEVQQILDNITL